MSNHLITSTSINPQVIFGLLTFALRRFHSGKGMFEAHKDLILNKGLGVFHFDCVAENLVATLT